MKKQKIKKFFKLHIGIFLLSFFIIGSVFGAFISYIITNQSSTGSGSNDSVISFSGGIDAGNYVNNRANVKKC